MKFISKLWRGEQTLGVTFWGGFVLPNMLFTFLFTYINARTGEVPLPTLVTAALALSLVYLVFFVFMFIAIWRSAIAPTTSTTWGWIARLIMLANAVYLSATLSTQVTNYLKFQGLIEDKVSSRADIIRDIKEIQAILPFKVDEITTFISARHDAQYVYYDYMLIDTRNIDVFALQEHVTPPLCNHSSNIAILKYYDAIKVSYYNPQQELLASFYVYPADCNPALKALQDLPKGEGAPF